MSSVWRSYWNFEITISNSKPQFPLPLAVSWSESKCLNVERVSKLNSLVLNIVFISSLILQNKWEFHSLTDLFDFISKIPTPTLSIGGQQKKVVSLQNNPSLSYQENARVPNIPSNSTRASTNVSREVYLSSCHDVLPPVRVVRNEATANHAATSLSCFPMVTTN